MTLTEMLQNDMAMALDHLPQTVTYHGATYACAVDDLSVSGITGFEGQLPTDGLEIHLATAALAGWTPARGDDVVFDGRTLRVAAVRTTPDGVETILECEARR